MDSALRILILHNYYQQRGGEDAVVEQERALLQANQHCVDLFAVHNHSIDGLYARTKAAVGGVYSFRSRSELSNRIHRFGPDLVHVHNFFPLLSPSIYDACRTAEIPVVQTLHNFRLVCPSAVLFRDGKPCELCVGKKVLWPGVLHACYRHSYAGSAALASMLSLHRWRGTWNNAIDSYITLTRFARQKLASGGLPLERLHVKPNFVAPDPGRGLRTGGFALFVGRLSYEKGIATLLSAWAQLHRSRQLIIAGDGPLQPLVTQAVALHPNIRFMGRQTASSVFGLMGDAHFLVLPSEWYEGFPRVIAEAFAKGLPVLASRLGSMEELIDHGRTGWLFPPGNAEAFAESAEYLFTHPAELSRMSDAARSEYETKYTAERNYEQLMRVYSEAIASSRRRVLGLKSREIERLG